MTRRIYDWKAIQEYHDQGHGFLACRRKFKITHYSWMKAIHAGLLRVDLGPAIHCRRRYDWSLIQAYYDEGHSYRECREKFGFNAMSWHKATKRGAIKPRPLGTPIELVPQLVRSRHAVKVRLLKAGLLVNRCDICGLDEWRGKPLSVHVDHINGVKDDHRLENLRMLCPNCHSQTETYGGKNRRLRRALQDQTPTV